MAAMTSSVGFMGSPCFYVHRSYREPKLILAKKKKMFCAGAIFLRKALVAGRFEYILYTCPWSGDP